MEVVMESREDIVYSDIEGVGWFVAAFVERETESGEVRDVAIKPAWWAGGVGGMDLCWLKEGGRCA